MTPLEKAYREWWDALTLEGDPLRIPNKFRKAFEAGWNAASRDALEKAARVCDDYKRDGNNTKEYCAETADELAARIRVLR
jgi:hypothetical protein